MSGDVVYLNEFLGKGAPKTPPKYTDAERDAAKRASDIINEAIQTLDWDQLRQCWIAIRLSDGSSDMVIYDTKRDAVRHQLHETQCAYIAFRNLIGGATPTEMLRYLRFNRMAYDAGMRMPDPNALDGGPDVAPTSGWMDAISGRVRGRR